MQLKEVALLAEARRGGHSKSSRGESRPRRSRPAHKSRQPYPPLD